MKEIYGVSIPEGRNFVEQLREDIDAQFMRMVLAPRAEYIESGTKFRYPEGFNRSLQKLVFAGYWPVVYSNHESHFDVYPLTDIAQNIMGITNAVLDVVAALEDDNSDNRMKGFVLPIASTLDSGDQGKVLKSALDASLEYAKQRGLSTIPFTRPKDETLLRAQGREKEILKNSGARLLRRWIEGYGIVIFPEATVAGGRPRRILRGEGDFYTAEDLEQISGMQEAEEPHLGNLFLTIQQVGKGSGEKGEKKKLLRAGGKKMVLIPVGIYGSYRVLNPILKWPTGSVLFAAFLSGDPHFVDVEIGMPMPEEQILEELAGRQLTAEVVHHHLMRKIVDLTPSPAHGIYSSAD